MNLSTQVWSALIEHVSITWTALIRMTVYWHILFSLIVLVLPLSLGHVPLWPVSAGCARAPLSIFCLLTNSRFRAAMLTEDFHKLFLESNCPHWPDKTTISISNLSLHLTKGKFNYGSTWLRDRYEGCLLVCIYTLLLNIKQYHNTF